MFDEHIIQLQDNNGTVGKAQVMWYEGKYYVKIDIPSRKVGAVMSLGITDQAEIEKARTKAMECLMMELANA